MLAASVENEVRRQDSLAERVQFSVSECMKVCSWASVFVAVVSEVAPYHDVIVIPCMNMDADIADGFHARWPSAKISFFTRQEDESKLAPAGGTKK